MLGFIRLSIAAMAITVVSGLGSAVQAGDADCVASVQSPPALQLAQADMGGTIDIWHRSVAAEPAIIPVQGTTMQRSVGGATAFPSRVPAGKTYAIQMEGQRSFKKFSSGATLAQTDCAQIPCPKSFEPGTVCWKCVESLTSQ